MVAPDHTVDIHERTTFVGREQVEFKMPERGELLPLELKTVARPETWLKNQKKNDLSWNQTYDSVQDIHDVPTCKIKKCKLDCKKLTAESVRYARSCLENIQRKY